MLLKAKMTLSLQINVQQNMNNNPHGETQLSWVFLVFHHPALYLYASGAADLVFGLKDQSRVVWDHTEC